MGSNGKPTLILEEGKDISNQIKTALMKMERPYGSSIKCLANYFDSRYNVQLKVPKDKDRQQVFYKALIRSAMIGVRKGILGKVERSFRVAPMHLYKEAPEGPITEKLKNSYVTMKLEKERVKKAAKRNPLCSFCMKSEEENRDGKREEMLSCVTCGNSGHPSCLKWSKELTDKVKELPSWECLECKWCSVCRQPGNDVGSFFYILFLVPFFSIW